MTASHADVLRGSSRVPAPRTRDEPLRTSAWEANHMRDYMDRRVTSPTWGPPPPCKQALIIPSTFSICKDSFEIFFPGNHL